MSHLAQNHELGICLIESENGSSERDKETRQILVRAGAVFVDSLAIRTCSVQSLFCHQISFIPPLHCFHLTLYILSWLMIWFPLPKMLSPLLLYLLSFPISFYPISLHCFHYSNLPPSLLTSLCPVSFSRDRTASTLLHLPPLIFSQTVPSMTSTTVYPEGVSWETPRHMLRVGVGGLQLRLREALKEEGIVAVWWNDSENWWWQESRTWAERREMHADTLNV